MRKLLMTAALVFSFILFSVNLITAGGGGDPYEGHTWDEKAISVSPAQPQPQPVILVHVSTWNVLIWKNSAQPGQWQGRSAVGTIGRFNYLFLRAK